MAASSGLAKAIGAPKTIPIGGVTYILAPLGIKDLGMVENELRGKMKSPVESVAPHLAGLDPKAQEMMLRIAYDDMRLPVQQVSREMLASFIDTLDGMKLCFWIMLRKNYPDMTKEQTDALWEKMGDDDLARQQAFARERDLVAGLEPDPNLYDGKKKPENQPPPEPQEAPTGIDSSVRA